MLKTYELREIIESNLTDFKASEDWEEFLLVETKSENHDTIYVNFVEMDEGKLYDNKYKITIERVID